MKTKVQCLEKGEMIVGTLVDFHNEDGFMEVTFEFRRWIRLEHHVDSEMGSALQSKIAEDMLGKKVGVYYIGLTKEPVRVAVRE